MMKWRRFGGPLAALCILGAVSNARAEDPSNGQRFDPGVRLTARSELAPKQLEQARFLLGRFAVERLELRGSTPRTTTGQAWISWMNRGHALQLSTHFPGDGPQGEARDTLGFLAFAAGGQGWNLGEADALDECVRMSQGDFENEALVLQDVRRPNGGPVLMSFRRTFAPAEVGFTVFFEESSDLGASWSTVEEQRFLPLGEAEPFPFGGEGFGTPDPDLPDEAREFDFLIGIFDAAQAIMNPGAPPIRFGSTSTAVYVLGGRGILEFSSYDVDPSLPESATSIVRLYNRAMRRWESLYLTNRGNTNLHFGGRREGARVVLTSFGVHRGNTISHYVFHDVAFETYAWFSEQSRDGGRTFEKTWTIDFRRRE